MMLLFVLCTQRTYALHYRGWSRHFIHAQLLGNPLLQVGQIGINL